MHELTDLSADALLTRLELSAGLTRIGLPVAFTTLMTKASRGGGPAYQIGPDGRARYRWGTGLAWARSRMSKVRGVAAEPSAEQEAA